jgi:hypothetical protein
MSGTAILVCLGALASDAGAETPNPRVLEVRAVAQRKGLLRGEVEITSKGWDARTASGVKAPFELTARVAFDNKKIRSRIFRPAIKQGADGWKEANTTVVCYGDDVHIWYSDAKALDGTRSLMNVTDLKVLSDTAVTRIADPRMLGVMPSSYPNLVHLDWESFVGSDSYKSITIESEAFAGDNCWKVTKVLLSDATVRSWFSPKKLGAIVRTEVLSSSNGHSYVESVDSDLEYHEPAKLWFPARCRFESKIDGQTQCEEAVEVRVIQLGRPVDPRLFTLEGLDIPAGTGIQRIPADRPGRLRWDGKRIVSIPVSDARDPAPERWESRRLIWTTCTAALALAAATCVWLLIRERRAM